jgi:hypothetical protein
MSHIGSSLVAMLGWGVEEFESCCKEASKEALLRAREILMQPDEPGQPEWIAERSRYGIAYIDKLLEKGHPE